ncbi:MAG: triose-phosphate isomerase [Lachnospiraceae bacterium]|nr:triose-phosphate isomerase [Lachnospiraceae bacterium]
MARKKIVAGNWKMNMTPAQAKDLIETLKPLCGANTDKDVVFCVPFIDIPLAVEAVKGTNIKIGAQNLYFEEKGAYTGEIAPAMIKEAGCDYVIIGHSERRAYFGETNEIVNKKVLKAYEHDLVPIICVGETLEQREQGITEELVRLQTKIALKDVDAAKAEKAVIAYEPIWAIGTGKTATNEQAQEVCGWIRNVLAQVYGQETADKIRVQYGGSVNAGNAADLFAMPDIDGGLVGGASLKADFAAIVNA